MSSLSPDDIVWRTPLLHPPKSEINSNNNNSNNITPNTNNYSSTTPQVSARCLEMVGGASLEWRMVVSEKSYPDGKQEVRIRNSKLSSAIAQPLVPPISLIQNNNSNNFSSPISTNNNNNNSSAFLGDIGSNAGAGVGGRIHFHAACLSMCVVPDFQNLQQKTTLWCGWSSGHISVHLVGGKAAGEIVECFVAVRGGGPVRILKSISSEIASSSAYNSTNSSTGDQNSSSSLNVVSRLVASASSDFSVTFWDSQNMRAVRTIQLGASIGMVKSLMLDKFAFYSTRSNDVTESVVLVKRALCIVGADNGTLIVIDCNKEILHGSNNNNINNESLTQSSIFNSNNNNNNSTISLTSQRSPVTSLAVLHFPDSPSVCISGSDGGVIRAQALSENNGSNNFTNSSSSSSTTISLQHGPIHAIAMLPTSSLPLAVGRGGSHGGANLVLAACASGRIFILLVGAGAAPELSTRSSNNNNNNNNINNGDAAPLLTAMASFVSPTGPVVQLCSRPGWSRAVYAVTSSGGVDLYASSEAVLNRIEIIGNSSSFGESSNHHHQQPQQFSSLLHSPSQIKSKSMSLVLQAERRYEQKIQLLLDLAVESKRHCEDRDGAALRLKEENEEKTVILQAMTSQCETLIQRVEQLRTANTKLENERSLMMTHARDATSTGTAAQENAEYLQRELKAANDRESNTQALMDQLRMRVISLEKELDQTNRRARQSEREADVERTRSSELENTLRVLRNIQNNSNNSNELLMSPPSPRQQQQQQLQSSANNSNGHQERQRELLDDLLMNSSSQQ